MLVSIALAAPVATAGPSIAAASTPTTMAAGSVVALPDPGVTLAVPADGRLNGYGFAGHVLGAATGRHLPGADGLRAAAGQQLWVFGLSWASDVTVADSNASVAQVTATVVADSTRMPVPIVQASPPGSDSTATGTVPPAPSGDQYFAASVPAGAPDVVVEMAADGFAQPFSLTHMAREGAQPAALYRSMTGWETVDAANASVALPTSYVASIGTLSDTSLHVDLPDVTLSYFGPNGATQPAPPGQAWLVPVLSDPFNPDSQDPSSVTEFFTPILTSGLTLTVPGQPALHPQQFPGGPDVRGGGDGSNGVFPDIYAFEVPVDTTTATLTVAPGTQLVTAAFSGAPETPVPVPSTNFPITFPAPQTPSPPAGAATTPAVITSSQLTSTAGSHGGSSGFPIWIPLLVVVAVAVAASGTGYGLRRRRLIAATASGPASRTESPTPAPPPRTEPTAASPPPRNGPTEPKVPPDSPTKPRREPSVLLVPPQGLPRLAPGQVRALILGLPLVEGLSPATGQTLVEIVIFLALHPGESFTSEQLRTRLGILRDDPKESRDLSIDTIRRYMGELRRLLGPELIPGGGGHGYQAVGIATDLAALLEALSEAETATTPVERAGHLAEALRWVRGAPFFDAPKPGYDWAYDRADLTSGLTSRIQIAAAQLADLALAAGDPTLTTWAAEQGLRVETSNQQLMGRLLRASHIEDRLEPAWTQIVARLARLNIEPGPELTALYHQLRNQPRPER